MAGAMHRALYQLWDSDMVHGFRHSPVAIGAVILAFLSLVAAVGAPWIAPHDTLDPRTLNLLDALLPPAWMEGGSWVYPLGTDPQGRDVVSAILYGSRSSIMIGFCAVLLSLMLGVTLGLVSGYGGGAIDALIMRIADVQLSFPAILVALLFDGIARI